MEKLKKQNYMVLLLVSFILISSCSTSSIEEQAKIIIKDDAQFLSTLDAVYILLFINTRENIIDSDDIFFRIDKGTVSHGFDVNEMKVEILTDNKEKVLSIMLPPPKDIAIDRKMLRIHNVHASYRPIDENKKEIDVENFLAHELHRIDQMHKEQTNKEIRKTTEQYFDGLAKKLGLTRAKVNFAL